MFEITDGEIAAVFREAGIEFAKDIALSILFSLLVDAALLAATGGISAKLSVSHKSMGIPVKVKSGWLNIVGFIPDPNDLGDLGSIYIIHRVVDSRGVFIGKYYKKPIIVPVQSYTKNFIPFLKGNAKNGSRQGSIGSHYYYNFRVGIPGREKSLVEKTGNPFRYLGTSLSNFLRGISPKEIQNAITTTKKIQEYNRDLQNLKKGHFDFLSRKYSRKLTRRIKVISKVQVNIAKIEATRQILKRPTRGITRGTRVIKRKIKRF